MLPLITDPVVVDATTEPDFAGDPVVQLSGGGTLTDGLLVTSSNTTIRGLSITRFSDAGVELNGLGNNIVEDNYLGLDTSGATAGNFFGLRIQNSPNNIVDGNVISGNNRAGVFVNGASANSNLLVDNLIGTDPTGVAARPNLTDGITNYAPQTQIGLAGQGNTISGNARWGIFTRIAGRTGVVVQGNQIGTDISGSFAVPNVVGIHLKNGPNTVGGTIADGNVISGC